MVKNHPIMQYEYVLFNQPVYKTTTPPPPPPIPPAPQTLNRSRINGLEDWHIFMIGMTAVFMVTLIIIYICIDTAKRKLRRETRAALVTREAGTLARAACCARDTMTRAEPPSRDEQVCLIVGPRADLPEVQRFLMTQDLNVKRVIYLLPRDEQAPSYTRSVTPPPSYPAAIASATMADRCASGNRVTELREGNDDVENGISSNGTAGIHDDATVVMSASLGNGAVVSSTRTGIFPNLADV